MFDIRSVFLVAALTSIVCAIMLWSMRDVHKPSRTGMLMSAFGEFFLGLTMLLIALRGAIPDFLSIPVANAANVAGSLIFYAAVRQIVGRNTYLLPISLIAVVIVAIQLYWGTAIEHHDHRILMTAVVQGGIGLALVPLLVSRLGTDTRVPLLWGIVFCLIFAGLQSFRIVETLTSGVEIKQSGMVGGSLLFEVMAAIAAITPMVFAMVLIGVVNGRISAEYVKLANIDSLTGLFSRRNFFESAQRELITVSRGRRKSDRESVLMMLDLDHFKLINDSLGHVAGDKVLSQFGQMLQESTPPDAIIGRYGGEEFCLLLPLSTAEEARSVAANICAATRALRIDEANESSALSVSIGIASTLVDGKRMNDLIAAADRRVYIAKAAGRDQYIDAQSSQGHDLSAEGGPDTQERRRRATGSSGGIAAVQD